MSPDLTYLNAIANGGAFDQTTAIRALARVVAPQATKQAPTATMAEPNEPEDATVKRRKTKPEATA